MSEIVVCVTDDAMPDDRYQDGDVLHAFNTKHIDMVHFGEICRPALAGLTKSGLRPTGTIAEAGQALLRQFKNERVSKYEVKRTNLWTGAEEVVKPLFDEHGRYVHSRWNDGSYMDVPLFIKRRRAHVRHLIFGSNGREIWYSGGVKRDAANRAALWNFIESHSSLRQADHTRFPFRDRTLFRCLVLPVVEMRDEVCARAESEEFNLDEHQPGFDPELHPQVTRKRRANVAWRSMGLDPAVVMDRSVKLDLRPILEPQGTEHLSVKARKNFWTVRDHLRAAGDREFFV